MSRSAAAADRGLGIGVLGLGRVAQAHLDAYRRFGLRVVAGCDLDPQAAARAAARWQLPRVFSGADAAAAMCSLAEVDVVDITVPHRPDLRLGAVSAAAAAGKPMQVQKPLARRYADAVRLVEVAERAGVPLRVNQTSIFVPAFAAVHAALRRREIGDVYYYQIENRGLWTGGYRYGVSERWIVSDIAVHPLALAQHWFGPPETVAAIGARDSSQPDFLGENLAVITLRYPSGLQGVIVVNWAYRGGRPEAPDSETIVVQGSGGAITATPSEVEVVTVDPPGRAYPAFEGAEYPDAFGHSMVHFLDALTAGRTPLCSGRDNLRVIAAIEAAYRSMERGGAPVRLAEIEATP